MRSKGTATTDYTDKSSSIFYKIYKRAFAREQRLPGEATCDGSGTYTFENSHLGLRNEFTPIPTQQVEGSPGEWWRFERI